jgi:Flp pilus assembly protein TadD
MLHDAGLDRPEGEAQTLPPAAPAPPVADAEPEEPAPEAQPPVPTHDWPRRVAALEDLRDVQGALDVVRSERARVPDDIPLLVAEIRILGTLGRFDAALAPLAELRRAAGEAPLVHLVAGVLHFRRGMYPEAEAELRTLTDSEEPAARPYRGEANYYLGESLNRMERVEEALEILRTAIELTPDDPRPYHTLGRLLDRKGAPDEAALMYRRAREAERAGKPS